MLKLADIQLMLPGKLPVKVGVRKHSVRRSEIGRHARAERGAWCRYDYRTIAVFVKGHHVGDAAGRVGRRARDAAKPRTPVAAAVPVTARVRGRRRLTVRVRLWYAAVRV
jgi:hypothetical protein